MIGDLVRPGLSAWSNGGPIYTIRCLEEFGLTFSISETSELSCSELSGRCDLAPLGVDGLFTVGLTV